MKPHHRVDGLAEAPVVVLASSLGTTLELWDQQASMLARAARLVRYDLRGHGRSDVPPGPYTVEQLAHDALELLDELGVERASFCGLSLGGAVAMWLAANAPERVDRLALCCTSARFGPPELWVERARLVRAEGTTAIADVAIQRWFTPAFRDRDPATVARFREQLLAIPREGYAACCDAIAGWDFREQLSAIQAPTLVVAGADDPATPPDHAELIAARIASARLVVLPHAAHLANVEQPEAVTQALLSHLIDARVPV